MKNINGWYVKIEGTIFYFFLLFLLIYYFICVYTMLSIIIILDCSNKRFSLENNKHIKLRRGNKKN